MLVNACSGDLNIQASHSDMGYLYSFQTWYSCVAKSNNSLVLHLIVLLPINLKSGADHYKKGI